MSGGEPLSLAERYQAWLSEGRVLIEAMQHDPRALVEMSRTLIDSQSHALESVNPMNIASINGPFASPIPDSFQPAEPDSQVIKGILVGVAICEGIIINGHPSPGAIITRMRESIPQTVSMQLGKGLAHCQSIHHEIQGSLEKAFWFEDLKIWLWEGGGMSWRCDGIAPTKITDGVDIRHLPEFVPHLKA